MSIFIYRLGVEWISTFQCIAMIWVMTHPWETWRSPHTSLWARPSVWHFLHSQSKSCPFWESDEANRNDQINSCKWWKVISQLDFTRTNHQKPSVIIIKQKSRMHKYHRNTAPWNRRLSNDLIDDLVYTKKHFLLNNHNERTFTFTTKSTTLNFLKLPWY